MKKDILFVINSLTIGGSEKSLVSLLNVIDYSKYRVDLLMLRKGESLDKYIPNEVNILDIPNFYIYLNNENYDKTIVKALLYRMCRIKSSIDIRLNKLESKKTKNNQQIFYINQKNILKRIEKKYDIAIAFAQGFPTYFVVDKVDADNKIAWINCDYKATTYNKELDKIFYDKIHKIVAVSESSKDSIINVNKNYTNKIVVIKDIVNPDIIVNMATEKIKEIDSNEVNILTVGRLVIGYKGYDIAIKTADLLRNSGYKFKWYVVGDGQDKEKLQDLVKVYDLEKYFILLGSRDNPYPYMKKCDIYVQPSRNEGFGLTVIEAKILKKPIVCTNFNTANELIKNEEDGLIVEQDEVQLLNGIKRYLDDNSFRDNILRNLKSENEYNTMNEIYKIYELFK
ncbi:glycosyltransferase [Clostridium sp. UBA5119]|uniref:glycosyltransferase n=1 Tax=Clostridium sp. UBA5119 TaxID=1946366 RepID=UPI003216A7BE